jgi:protein-S-isoprenylcysteine O-methyltransferase Ste14
MDAYTFWAIFTLVLAISVNSSLVYVQKKHNLLTRKFGKHALNVHSLMLTIVWGIFIIVANQLTKSDWRLDSSYTIVGTAIIAISVIIFVLALWQIGTDGLINANFFGATTKKLKGIYNYLPEPIYASYVLLLFGIGLQTSIKGYFLLSILALVGLYGVEARVESVD